MTSGNGGGEASRCGLDGVSSTASGEGVQGFLPSGVAAAGTAVAVEGSWAELAPKVEALYRTVDGNEGSQPWRRWRLMTAGCRKRWRSEDQQRG
jgi:hypothetical protein